MLSTDAFNYVNVLDKAADASWSRENILTNNIANVNTPGYKRKDLNFENTLKTELFEDEVYVFTPKGKIKVLPRDATPIDFAYAIHEEIGHHMCGCKINSKMMPIVTKLKNGDIVLIYPEEEMWFNYRLPRPCKRGAYQFAHELDVTNNPALYYIDCQSNDLATLDISKNEGLIWLNAQLNSKLGNIDFSKNKEIRDIIVYGASNMTAIDVSNNQYLLNLDVSQTALSTIDLSKNLNLSILSVSYTNITTLDLSKNTKLTQLYFTKKDVCPY